MKHVLILSIAVTGGVCALAATFATHKFRSDTATTEQRSDTAATERRSDTAATERRSDTATTEQRSDTAATERQRDGAAFQTAWAELRRLESYTKVGLSFDQYSERVLTAQANIDAALSRVTVKGLVETKFRHAMGDYTKALDVWRMSSLRYRYSVQYFWERGREDTEFAAQYASASDSVRPQLEARHDVEEKTREQAEEEEEARQEKVRQDAATVQRFSEHVNLLHTNSTQALENNNLPEAARQMEELAGFVSLAKPTLRTPAINLAREIHYFANTRSEFAKEQVAAAARAFTKTLKAEEP